VAWGQMMEGWAQDGPPRLWLPLGARQGAAILSFGQPREGRGWDGGWSGVQDTGNLRQGGGS
jgi:hypothetical protein